MKCDCRDCGFRGMELCEHRKLMDEVNRLQNEVNRLKATIQEAKDRMRYYFGTFGGTFPDNPQMQNVYDVLGRDDDDDDFNVGKSST